MGKLIEDVENLAEDAIVGVVETIFPKLKPAIDDIKEIKKDIQDKEDKLQKQEIEQVIQNVNESMPE